MGLEKMTLKRWNVSEYSAQQYADFETLFEISRHVGRKDVIFSVHGSFGDVYTQLAVLAELVDRGVSFAILVDEKYKQLALIALRGGAQIVFVNQVFLNNVLTRKQVLGFSESLPVRLLPTLYPVIPELMLSGLLEYSDFLRFLVHREMRVTGAFRTIEGDAERHEALRHLHDLNLRPGRTLLISPFNNTQAPLSVSVILQIISLAQAQGWDVCINNAASRVDLTELYYEARNVVYFSVPPHLAVSFASSCGSYVVGNNGFATIQALFNNSVRGVHLINPCSDQEDYIKDQAGNFIEKTRFFHANTFKNEFLGLQIEHQLDSLADFNCGEKILKQVLS